VFGNGSEVLRRKPAYLRELDRIQTLVGGFSLMDLFPSSRLARSLNTCERDVKKSFDTFEKIMDDIILERRARGMAAEAGDEEEPLLDVLLRLQKDKDAFSFPLTDEIIRVVISVRTCSTLQLNSRHFTTSIIFSKWKACAVSASTTHIAFLLQQSKVTI
jgi:hypothetical protein